MKKLKKLLTIVLALSLLASVAVVFAGCGMDGEELDDTKFQLKISAYEAGYGVEWLNNYKATFEEAYADYTHPDYPEKQGVQVSIDWNQNSNAEILAKIALDTVENHLYFNSVNVYDLSKSGDAFDLTSILQADMADVGEAGKTLESKIETDYQNYLKAYNDKYYAMPMFETYEGIQYNVELFERKGFYFSKGSSDTDSDDLRFTTGIVAGADGVAGNSDDDQEKAEGPDGKSGTADDGLPVTYDEFFELCEYMKDNSVTPFVWSGAWTTYANMLPRALWVNNEGLEQMRLNYTFSGTAKTLIDVDEYGDVTRLDPVQITDNNAYMLQKQEGLYRALQFVHELVQDPDNYQKDSFGASTHTDAQDYFISEELIGNKPIAFLVEGTYWQAEAQGKFNGYAQEYGDQYGYEQSRYGFMPLPTYEKKANHKNTVLSGANTCFADGQISGYEIELVQKFLQFISTDTQLYEFLKLTHYSRAMKMELTDDQYSTMSYYAKSMYDIRKESDICYTFSENKFYLHNSSSHFTSRMQSDGWYFNYSGQLPVQDMRNNPNLTAEKYFNECYKTFESKWQTIYYDYFNGLN